ncbi:MAG: chloride channel protein [Elusimicrobiales bacterium]|nr:chloride channel protein [Elusimicrobiales bacterium]
MPYKLNGKNPFDIISFREQIIIFYDVIKWTLLATVIGAAVGAATALFLNTLETTTAFVRQYNYYFLMLPIVFYFNYLLVKYFPDIEGHGTEKVIYAIHKKHGKIKWQVVPLKLITTVSTLAFGGSAGKEGPCAQIGGGIASIFADLVRLTPSDRKKIVTCGISAGFAAVFGTPLAGAIFGVEALFVGSMIYEVLLPSFVAGITAYQVASFFGADYFYHTLNFIPVFTESFFIKVILAGAFFGICSFLLIEFMSFFHAIAKKIKQSHRAIIGGLSLIILAMIFSTEYLGLGLPIIERSIGGEMNMWYTFLLKIIFTSITLSFYGSGGIVTPILFIGATSGTLFADLFGLSRETFAALGFTAVLAGATNTPIASSIMAIEIFGKEIAPYASLACIVSFLVTGYRSVYPSQILSTVKSGLLKTKMGQDIEDVCPEIEEDKVHETLIGDTEDFANNLKDKLSKISAMRYRRK